MIRNTGLLLAKQFAKQSVRNGAGMDGGIPGETLPFKLGQKWKLTFMYIMFYTVPWWAPYLVVMIHMNK